MPFLFHFFHVAFYKWNYSNVIYKQLLNYNLLCRRNPPKKQYVFILEKSISVFTLGVFDFISRNAVIFVGVLCYLIQFLRL